MIEAIVFDFDGTIVETEMPDYQSWQEIYLDHGVRLPLEAWVQSVGGAPESFDPYAYLEGLLGRSVDRAAIRSVRRPRFLELIAEQPLRPGVMAWLDEAKSAGVGLAVASSSDREWVTGHLRARHLTDRFTVVRTADDVARVKPDPALFLSAAAGLGVAPGRALAIEDSRNGVLAAKAAGMKCLVVPNPVTCDLPFEQADWRLDSLADQSLAGIVSRMGC